MKIVLDTNIVFSALISPESTISRLLFSSDKLFSFYTCDYLEVEIRRHWAKLSKMSGLTSDELTEAMVLLFERIKFINKDLIPWKVHNKADLMVKDIDPDDIDFVALSMYLNAKLLTGDKKLYAGLKSKGFSFVMNTQEMLMKIM